MLKVQVFYCRNRRPPRFLPRFVARQERTNKLSVATAGVLFVFLSNHLNLLLLYLRLRSLSPLGCAAAVPALVIDNPLIPPPR